MIFKHLSHRRRLTSRLLSIALLPLFIMSPQQGRSVQALSSPLNTIAAPGPAQAGHRISFDPSAPSVSAGAKVTVTAKVLDKDGAEVTPKPGDSWTWMIADPSLEDFLALIKDGNRATLVGLLGNSKTGEDRPTLIPIIVTVTGSVNATGVLNVHMADAPLARGPIPPGIAPQVDVMWAVMPQKITHDNFGGKIKKQYYGIEVVIGNDSGYDLELASVGFDLREGGLDTKGLISSRVPTSGYRVARASLQRRQLLNLRNMTLNTIKALGPILTGFTPFFHNLNRQNNFAEGVNILSNPIEKGLELAWPDLTLGQLANLEDQSLRDNAITRTVVKNNTQVRFVVFVPKDLINYSKEDNWWRDQPLEVMKRLGRMILIGDQVEHINRVRVVSSSETGAAFSISGKVIDPCLEGIEGVTVTLNQAGGFSSSTTTDESGRYSFENVPSGLAYTVTVSKDDTTFRPPTGNSFTLHGNRTVDFSTDQITISGQITRESGDDRPLTDVVLSLTSGSGTAPADLPTTKPDEDGNYKFSPVPAGATYLVTPTSNGRAFEPESITVRGLRCDSQTVNFKQKPKE